MKIIGKQLLYLHRSKYEVKSSIGSDHYQCEGVFYSNDNGSLIIMEIDCRNENQCENEGHSVFSFDSIDELISFIKEYPDVCSNDLENLILDIKKGFELKFI